jgi:crotonobetainyl-CoA:carnitine CoA-transferase CaiB-like acyl-CoA transferase
MMDFQAARFLVDGVVPQQAGNQHPYSTPMGVVRTSDGYINIAVGGPAQWKAFCPAIGCPELADHPDYASQDKRLQNRYALNARLAEIFEARPSAYWLAALEQANVPAGPIYKMDEVFRDPQVKHLNIAVPVSDGDRNVTLVGLPINMSRTPAGIARLLPDAGADNDDILSELGFTQSDIEKFRSNKVV